MTLEELLYPMFEVNNEQPAETISNDDQQTDYMKYRGKCREYAERLCKEDESLRLVRGWYDCPFWGRQEHWWAEESNGNIIDPTKKQFPSKGIGEYIEYNGILQCEYCGKNVKEDDAYLVEHHVYCSGSCYGRDIGF